MNADREEMWRLWEDREEMWRLWESDDPRDWVQLAIDELRGCLDNLPPSAKLDAVHAGNCALRASAAMHRVGEALRSKAVRP